jgi:hypothetical protein
MLQTADELPGIPGALGTFCVRGLRAEHQLVIAGRIHFGAGRTPDAIGYSPSQVRARWDQVKGYVLVPLGLPNDDALMGIWIACHAACFTAPAFSLLRSDGRFAGGAV